MVISKKLILAAFDPFNDFFIFTDKETEHSIEFASFGDFEYQGKTYIFGVLADKYLEEVENDSPYISIEFFEISEDDNKHTAYSSNTCFTSSDEYELAKILANILEVNIAERKKEFSNC